MKIINVKTWVVGMPLKFKGLRFSGTYGKPKKDFEKNADEISFKHHRVIVMVETDEGMTGAGEAPGIPGNVFETELVINTQIAPKIMNMDPFDIEPLISKIRAVTPYAPHSHINPALSGVEIALWDIIGKILKVPVYKLLGGAVRKEIPMANYIYMYSINNVKRMAEEAGRHYAAGYRNFKVKIGRDPKEDVQIVKAVREAIGPKSNLRVDPNQAWSSSYAVKMIKKLERFNLEFIEQPVPRWDTEGIKEVKSKVEVPICACELAWDHKDIFEIIRNRIADIINLDVHRCGGILECKKLAHAAEVAGFPCGLHTGGSLGPSTAAGLHIAASTSNIPLALDQIYDWFADDVIVKPFKMSALMKVPDGAGLGIELDLQKLEKYTVKKIKEGWVERESVPIEIPFPPPRFWI